MKLSERIREVLRVGPDAEAIEFGGRWYRWADLARWVGGVEEACAGAGVEAGAAVGVLLRNRPSIVGALLGVLAADRCLVCLNPMQGAAKLADEIRTLRLPLLVAGPEDWARLEVAVAAKEVGSGAIELDDRETAWCRPMPELAARRPGTAHHEPLPGVAVRMLTSGTTGPAKRVSLTYRSLEESLLGAAAHYESGASKTRGGRLPSGVVIVSAPLVHVSGLWRTLQAIVEGRRIALLERFTVDGWRDAVRRHRPKVASLVPTALRMVLDADLPKEDLASLRAVTSGTAPLAPEIAVAFERRYGIPVLPLYGATEFAGGVAGWTLDDHARWGDEKRGSVGRAHPGCALRVVDPADGRALGPGRVGLLEVRSAQLGRDSGWVRTTDLAELDTDGFLWIRGRADDAIVRGGFKIAPGDVAAVLERHPSVREAAVVGIPDDRLGMVPVAAVELEAAAPAVDEDALRAFAREHLASYQVPARIRIVDALPRTPSMKVSRPAVAALFAPSGALTLESR